MKKRMYSVRDNKTMFWPPMEGYNDPAAVRDFEQLVNKNEMMYLHPGDFDLYFVGTFDNDTGIFDSCTPIQFVVSASSVVNIRGNENAK